MRAIRRFAPMVLGLALGLSAPGAPPASAQVGPLDEAHAAIARGDYAAAEKSLAEVKSGDVAAARLDLARVQMLRGRYVEAAKTAQDLAKQNPKAKAAAVAIQADALAHQGKLAEAISLLQTVEGDPDARRARLLLGELLIRDGKRGEARAPLMTLIDDYNSDAINATDPEGLSMVGRAAHLLRSARDANDAYNEAEKAGAKQRVESLLWRAELFLEKYDPGHAAEVVREAVKLAPKDPRVRVALARVKLEDALDFAGADAEIEEALKINPRLASAYFVRAGLALRDLEIEEADAAVAKGLETNPIDLELLSMKGAIRFLADDRAGFEAVKKRVFELNPGYTGFFHVVGEYAEWEHRYDEIIAMMEEATRVDSQDPKVYAALGLNLIRAGREDEGLKALQEAWDKDRFNVRVYNTLNLYERDIATTYMTVEGQPFRIRYHKGEKAVLERYVPKMLNEAWGSMVKRYKFTPKTPVMIELYADSEHFSVRTSGLPHIGIQGVCFGSTLAMLSPTAAPFNWGNVLWHELGHVFAIQLSESHVPRWFTEGLSEYETIIRRPEWQREEDPALFAALKGKRIPSVARFNQAFTHVDSVEDVTMAYFAASQIVVYMAEAFGFDKVVSMMPRWARGERTPEVIQGSLGITTEELDRRFRAWLEPRLARYGSQYVPDLHAPPLPVAEEAAAKAPSDARKQVELALALLREGDMEGGSAAIEAALKLDARQPDANYLKLRLALAESKADAAKAIIERMVKDGHDGYVLRMKAADIAEVEKDYKAMKKNLEAAHRFDPSQAEPLQGLVDLAHKLHDGAGEVAALRKLALVDQHDRRVWHRLLEGLVARGMWEEARKVGESAIFVDVLNPEIHRLYARALARTGRHVSAIFEYNTAIIARAEPTSLMEIYGELAKAYDKMGKKDLADRAREYQRLVEKSQPLVEG